MNMRAIAALTAATLVLSAAWSARAASLEQPLSVESDWRIEITGWLWLMGVKGEQGTYGRVADTSASFLDIVDDSDSLFQFAGRIEVGRGQWGVFANGLHSTVGVDDVPLVRGLSADVDFRMRMVAAGVSYRLVEWVPSGKAAAHGRNGSLDIFAGARYTDLRLAVSPANVYTLRRRIDWVDPIIGAKAVVPVTERWSVLAIGDIGGLGIDSRFSWAATVAGGYETHFFGQDTTLYLGYRVVGQDASRGGFTWDVIQHGPVLGLSFRF